MNTLGKGILWFDNSDTPLADKYSKAALYYLDKLGELPNICYVHPSMLKKQTIPGHLEILPYRHVLPGCLWIGMKEN